MVMAATLGVPIQTAGKVMATIRHEAIAVEAPASIERLFEHLDDPSRITAHMANSSAIMFGAPMTSAVDLQEGRAIGSVITMSGSVLGFQLSVRETIVERDPPRCKVWETQGPQRMIVMDWYRMGFDLHAVGAGSSASLFIAYTRPARGLPALAGFALARRYARWCLQGIAEDVAAAFPGTRIRSE
jgi:hypothetical protein